MKDRIELAKHFNKLGFKRGAEIGVADGRYAEILCQEIPELELFAIDPWMPYKGNWRGKDYQDKAMLQAISKLEPYNATLLKMIGQEAVNQIEDESLDFVFIDGDHHFDFIMEDIISWSRKVKKGGIVSGHDYYEFSSGDIMLAVDTYAQAHNIKLHIIDKNLKGHKDDRVPCWYFIKE